MTTLPTPPAREARHPAWSRPSEAGRLFLRGVTIRTCAPVAAVVGCVLSAVNEGTLIVSGHAGWSTWVRVAVNFLVPLLVSSYGYLSAARVPGLRMNHRDGSQLAD